MLYQPALELVREFSKGINLTEDLQNRNALTKTFGNTTQRDFFVQKVP